MLEGPFRILPIILLLFTPAPSVVLPRWHLWEKKLPISAGDMRGGFKPQVKKIPGGGHGNPFQYSYLENLMDGGAWQAIVHGVAQSQTRLNNLACMHTPSVMGCGCPGKWCGCGWGGAALSC